MNENYYLKYTVTIDDLIAFNMYHAKNSPSMLRQFHLYQRGVPIIIFILFLFQSIVQRSFVPFFIGLIIASFGYFYFTSSYYSSVKRNVSKMIRERGNQAIVGEHTLELANNQIIERTSVREMKIMVSALERVETSSEYAFIYISSVEAHVIPKSSITEGNLKTFLEELDRKREDSLHAYD